MVANVVQRHRVTVTILSMACIALALSIADDAMGSPQGGYPFGGGRHHAPVVSLSPTSLSFGGQPVNETSQAQTIKLENTGSATLSISSLTITGTNAGDFAQTNQCSSRVSAGATCTISVTFTPLAMGSRTASISITDNASGSPQTVSLTGTGTAALVSLSPTSLSFGKQSVGTPSTALTVTLRDTGNAALSIKSLTLTGTNVHDFAQTNTCRSSLTAGANCTIKVTFTPSASGSRTASISITDNASGSPQTVSLAGTGTSTSNAAGVTAAVASVSPTSLPFGNLPIDVASSPQSLTLSNTGNATLSIDSLALTGTNANDFAQSNTCGSSLATSGNNSSCTIVVIFTPSLAGAESAAVSITDNASGSPQTVSLSGTGMHDVILTWAPSAGAFGYDIYRGTTSGGESAAPLNTSPVAAGCTSSATCTYADATVAVGTIYYYYVTAVASDGATQSAPSSEVSAIVQQQN